MEEIQVAKNIDIWYEASQIKPEIYVREKAIQAFHLQQMQLKALHNETIASVFEAWEDQPIRFFSLLLVVRLIVVVNYFLTL